MLKKAARRRSDGAHGSGRSIWADTDGGRTDYPHDGQSYGICAPYLISVSGALWPKSGTLRKADDDLADMLLGLEPAVGSLHIGRFEDRVDDGLDPMTVKKSKDVGQHSSAADKNAVH